MIAKSYRYRPNLTVFVLSTLFFAGVAAILTRAALTNNQGALINGLIELSVDQATIFYWTLAACGFGFVLLGLVGIGVHFRSEKSQLVIHDDHLDIPPLLFHRRHRVHFRDVRAIKWYDIAGTRIFEMHTSAGKVGVSNRLFRNRQEFEEACAHLEQMILPHLPQ